MDLKWVGWIPLVAVLHEYPNCWASLASLLSDRFSTSFLFFLYRYQIWYCLVAECPLLVMVNEKFPHRRRDPHMIQLGSNPDTCIVAYLQITTHYIFTDDADKSVQQIPIMPCLPWQNILRREHMYARRTHLSALQLYRLHHVRSCIHTRAHCRKCGHYQISPTVESFHIGERCWWGLDPCHHIIKVSQTLFLLGNFKSTLLCFLGNIFLLDLAMFVQQRAQYFNDEHNKS